MQPCPRGSTSGHRRRTWGRREGQGRRSLQREREDERGWQRWESGQRPQAGRIGGEVRPGGGSDADGQRESRRGLLLSTCSAQGRHPGLSADLPPVSPGKKGTHSQSCGHTAMHRAPSVLPGAGFSPPPPVSSAFLLGMSQVQDALPGSGWAVTG